MRYHEVSPVLVVLSEGARSIGLLQEFRRDQREAYQDQICQVARSRSLAVLEDLSQLDDEIVVSGRLILRDPHQEPAQSSKAGVREAVAFDGFEEALQEAWRPENRIENCVY